jgi:DNA repair protein RecO (recombination protein O)
VARARAFAAARTETTRALLLRRVDYAESDLVITLFTEQLGRISALARGARKSQRRFGGAIEPMHTLGMRLDERSGAELLTLREASIEIARRRLVGDLDRMTAAGRALGWLRRAAPARTPEPEVWRVISDLLDRLDDGADALPPRLHLGEVGLRLLLAFGWGMDFERCVRCGKSCEPDRPALLDPARGGLVCRACGGARLRLEGGVRDRLARAARGEARIDPTDVDTALAIAESALKAHAGVE